jgi:hypothetical protein
MTMKATKNINARYDYDTGKWAIRDNGEILAQGQGIEAYCEAVKEIKKTATKKVVDKMVNLW